MAAIDEQPIGRAGLAFSDERDIDEFVDMLQQYESGAVDANAWRGFRLLRGTYGQRQEDGIQMMRIKIPQGLVSGPQMRALADVAQRYSRGFGHISTRQNVQFHFVALADAEKSMRELAETGLTTREACGNSVRNITACPYAGTSPTEVFDVMPYAEALTRYFLRHPLSSVLPRKFKIAFEGCPEDHAMAAINDIGWWARIKDGRRGFRVTVSGGTSIMAVSGIELYDFLPVEEMLNVGEAIVRVFHRFGDYKHRQRNRMKFMIKAMGFEAWREQFEVALEEFRREGGATLGLPGALPEEGPPDWTRPAAPSLETVKTTADTPVKGPGIVPGSLTLPTLSDAMFRWMSENVEPQRQAGYVHVTARLLLGDMSAGQMRVLADLAEAYGDGTMRLTIEQNVLFRWVPADAVKDFYLRLEAAGLGSPDARRLSDVVSCPGAETCRLAVTQSRGLGRVLTEQLSARPDLVDTVPAGAGEIKISGCPNGCGQHHIAAIGFQGSVRKLAGKALPQYFVLVGGGLVDGQAHFGKVVSKVPVNRLGAALERLLALYKDRRTADESLGAFYRRLPPSEATEALKDLAAMTPEEAQPADFFDLGEDREFAPEVMEGECSA
jgi:sulfite reductase (NADPH) hemoprotein beta-component